MRYKQSLTYAFFLVLFGGLTYLAFSSWSNTLYPSMNPLLMPVFLLATFFLLLLLVNGGSPLQTRDKFVLLIVHSFLTRMISIIVYFPGISGDNWQHLGRERAWDIFGQYYLLNIPKIAPEMASIPRRMYTVQRSIMQQSLVVTLAKMLQCDIYWVHLLFMGVLWSFFVPLIAFKISKMLGGSERASLLAGFLVSNAPILLLWSSYPVPNSLGLFFAFITIYFALRCISDGKRKDIFLLAVAALSSLLTHPLTGSVAVSVVLLTFAFKKYLARKESSRVLTQLPMFLGFAISVVLPASLSVSLRLIYPAGDAYFSFDKFLAYDIYQLIFAEYSTSTFMKGLLELAILGLGVAGMIFYQKLSKRRELSLFLILLFVSLVLQHRVLYYFVENPLFGPSRFYIFLPLFAGLFAALLLDYSLSSFRLGLPNKLNPLPELKIKRLLAPERILTLFVISIGLSALLVEASLSDFRHVSSYGPVARVSLDSMEAVRLIHEEYERTGERYAVVGDSNSVDAGVGLVGSVNPDEFYVIGTYKGLYVTALKDHTSPDPLIQTGSINNSSMVYLIVAKWSIERYLGKSADFQAILDIYGMLYEQFAVVGSGDGQIYIFRYRIPLAPYEGTGPKVMVIKDSQQVELNTTYSYKILSSVTYSLTLTGASTYNVTGWPMYWSYEEVLPRPTGLSLDVNAWIYLTGTPERTYTVKWFADGIYPKVGWKDDSFTQGYSLIRPPSGTYSLTSDGDIATETISGTPGEYIIYTRTLPPLTGFKGVVLRLKGTPNAYFAFQMYDPLDERTLWVWSGWKKPNSDFMTYFVPASPDATFTQMWLLIKTTDGNLATVDWDYVMLINP